MLLNHVISVNTKIANIFLLVYQFQPSWYIFQCLKLFFFDIVNIYKNPPANVEPACQCVQSLGRDDALEEGMATHSSILPWRIPWTEEPGGYSPQDHKELDMTEVTQHTLHAHLSISLLCAKNLKVSRTGRLNVSLIHTPKRLFVQSRFSNSHSPGPEGKILRYDIMKIFNILNTAIEDF